MRCNESCTAGLSSDVTVTTSDYDVTNSSLVSSQFQRGRLYDSATWPPSLEQPSSADLQRGQPFCEWRCLFVVLCCYCCCLCCCCCCRCCCCWCCCCCCNPISVPTLEALLPRRSSRRPHLRPHPRLIPHRGPAHRGPQEVTSGHWWATIRTRHSSTRCKFFFFIFIVFIFIFKILFLLYILNYD